MCKLYVFCLYHLCGFISIFRDDMTVIDIILGFKSHSLFAPVQRQVVLNFLSLTVARRMVCFVISRLLLFTLLFPVCSEFRDELLKSHNTLRATHGCKQLRYSEELTRDTQMWADIIADKGYVQFSELPGIL